MLNLLNAGGAGVLGISEVCDVWVEAESDSAVLPNPAQLQTNPPVSQRQEVLNLSGL